MEHGRRVIAIAIEDAGPAAYLAEVIPGIEPRPICLASPIAAAVLSRRGIMTEDVSPRSGEGFERALEARLSGQRIRGVLTGTCLGFSTEKTLLSWAARRGVPSASVIEHWSNYRERFEDEHGRLALPDHIIVNDERARDSAVQAGLPYPNLRILGNPVLERTLSESSPIKREQWLAQFGLPSDRKVVVFVSEQCAGLDLGFDERQVVEDILTCLPPDCLLMIKPHPAEALDKYSDIETRGVHVATTTDCTSLASHADKVIGMGSMLLLEAALLRGDVLSYRPGQRRAFVGNEIGATRLLQTQSELSTALKEPRRPPSDWGAGFAGSRKRFATFLSEAFA